MSLALKLQMLVHPLLCSFGQITEDERNLILSASEVISDLSALLRLSLDHCPEDLRSDILDALSRCEGSL